jgi:hypothetical protein
MTERDYGDHSYQRSSGDRNIIRNNSHYNEEPTEYRGDLPPSRRAYSSGSCDRDSYYRDDDSEYSPRSRRGRRDYYNEFIDSSDDNVRTRGTRPKARDGKV